MFCSVFIDLSPDSRTSNQPVQLGSEDRHCADAPTPFHRQALCQMLSKTGPTGRARYGRREPSSRNERWFGVTGIVGKNLLHIVQGKAVIAGDFFWHHVEICSFRHGIRRNARALKRRPPVNLSRNDLNDCQSRQKLSSIFVILPAFLMPAIMEWKGPKLKKPELAAATPGISGVSSAVLYYDGSATRRPRYRRTTHVNGLGTDLSPNRSQTNDLFLPRLFKNLTPKIPSGEHPL